MGRRSLLRRPCHTGLRRELPELRSRQLRRGLLARDVQILGTGGRRTLGAQRRRVHGGAGRAPVGEGAYDSGGGVRHLRAEVERAARRRGRRRGRLRRAYAAELDGAGVTAAGLVRAGLGLAGCGRHLGHDGGGRGRGLRVDPGALGARHQEQIVVVRTVLGGVEEGVGTGSGDARLFHHACVLRQSLARDLAGVSHAYPSPICSAPSACARGRTRWTREAPSLRTCAPRGCERPAGINDTMHCRGPPPPWRSVSATDRVGCATLRVPRMCRTANGSQRGPLFRPLASGTPNGRVRYNDRPAYPP